MAEEKEFRNVIIEGVRRRLFGKVLKPTKCKINLNIDAPISEIWTKFEAIYTVSYGAQFGHAQFFHQRTLPKANRSFDLSYSQSAVAPKLLEPRRLLSIKGLSLSFLVHCACLTRIGFINCLPRWENFCFSMWKSMSAACHPQLKSRAGFSSECGSGRQCELFSTSNMQRKIFAMPFAYSLAASTQSSAYP